MTELVYAIEATPISRLMNWSWWAWPTAESLHFIGLSLLFGTVVLFDLRLLGFAKAIPPAELHRLVPWGIAGFGLSLCTGALFFTGIPGMYLGNPAFWTKMVLLLAAGINVGVYYATSGREVSALGPDQPVPAAARICAGASLVIWLGILVAGRLIAFYKP